MKKKVIQKVKRLTAKPKAKKVVTTSSSSKKKTSAKPPAKPPIKVDPRFTQAVQNYEAGLRAMQGHKFERAKPFFTKVLDGPSKELADRARMYLNTCNQQLASTSTTFRTAEEHYDYAVSLMNGGDYDGTRSHLEKILKQNSKADYAVYGMAVLDSLTNRVEDCLRNLQHAIKLNPANRFQARNDSDFTHMIDDPRFTDLLYPDPDEIPLAPPAASTTRNRP